MSLQYALIGVEGNHDQALVGKILEKILGLQKFDGLNSNLDSFWRKFIPTYPPKTGRLYARLDMPSIFFNDSLSIAIYAGQGESLSQNLKVRLSDISLDSLLAFGIIADADKKFPEDVAKTYAQEFQVVFPHFPETPGIVSVNSVRTGVFILPDNVQQGVLETLLLECGKVAYPEYLERAISYINQFSETEQKSLKWKPFDREKALIATVVSVLKPGKTNQVSLADNHWISETTYQNVQAVQKIVDFLKNLLDLTA
ncbi:hypothetical protein K4A83_18210 [Spirulina subsalsa FACHB-351]|uniref:DUF3226 domain-containing protein n=1 Tax=Spirulina subsalsa FACHB-351 TaxID=234711 RepID=A0ABT3L9L6_9CYAN|nr:DUF3226 domain-containing protein [Spirulina subsalsa]MCW6038190.1 hypothetical protein [Spirulina subsalsa FACHB-351]